MLHFFYFFLPGVRSPEPNWYGEDLSILSSLIFEPASSICAHNVYKDQALRG